MAVVHGRTVIEGTQGEVPAITWEGARFGADAVAAVAGERGSAPVACVVDPGGELVYVLRPDWPNAGHVDAATARARTAARGSATEGAAPIEHRGEVIGAIGVTGTRSVEEDSELAAIGARAVAFERYRPYRFAGGLIYLDVEESPAMRRRAEGKYEPGKAAALQRLLKPGMTFVDVGSNKGDFSLIAARVMHDEGRVFAFEPVPENSRWIRESIDLNGYRIIEIVELALSDAEGHVPLYLGERSGWHSLVPGEGFSGETIEVPMRTLDSFLSDSGDEQADVIKIDVEGAELEVLRGADRTLRRARAVLVDVHPRRGVDPGEVFDLLLSHGFSLREPKDIDTPVTELPEKVHEFLGVRDGPV